ncbi:uncharacterized protein [Clytia hemisphaerica]|uniref:uncharacterized protein n=1 Tax=Clytia hemisphaerica TaxID=252671 RepID=UPI0034D65741
MKGRIIVFSILGCPFCIKCKGYLDQLGLNYIDVNLDKNSLARQKVIEMTGQKTVPQVFFNERHVGGWDNLSKLSKEELNDLINLVEQNEPPKEAPNPSDWMEADDETEVGKDMLEFHCELDEYAELTKELRDSGIVGDHWKNLKNYKNSFVGKEAVDWLVKYKNLERKAAVEMCQQLVERHFGHNVKRGESEEFKDDDSVYQFIEDVQANALNAGIKTQCEPRPGKKRKGFGYFVLVLKVILQIIWDMVFGTWRFLLRHRFFLYVNLNTQEDSRINEGDSHEKLSPHQASELGEELRQLILAIYNNHLSPDGKKVDYRSIAKDEKFKLYATKTAELQRVNVEEATREEKLAFFINIYNALVIHAFVVVGPPANLWQRYKFFNTVSYIIGGYTYSLNEIENGVLRSNRKPLGSFKKPFSKTDPRLKIALETCEPKVHFALVCGAKSCPPIKTYSAKEVDSLLKLSAESFLEGDGVEVDMKKREVRISPILKWYKEDFGSNKQEYVQYVRDNMGDCEKKRQIDELLQSGNFKLGYLKYDWSVNSK